MGLKKLYLDNGYLNFDWVFSKNYPYIFMVGAKSIGKTYGSLLYALDNKIKFIYMRRTQTQLDSINDEEDSPFLKINLNTHYNIQPKKISKSFIGYYNAEFNIETNENELIGLPIGYGLALSTFHNISSIGFNDVDLLIYDEFIPMYHERMIKDESLVFFKFIDNIARNRELENKKPLQVICMANADRLDNALFLELGLTDVARRNNDELYYDNERGLMLIQPLNSPITEKKKETSLYKLTKGTRYYQLAIENKFNIDDSIIKSMNLKQFDLYCIIDELCFYKHKSEYLYYCTKYKKGDTKNKYTRSKKDLKAFRQNHRNILNAFIKNKLYFENYECFSIYQNNVKI